MNEKKSFNFQISYRLAALEESAQPARPPTFSAISKVCDFLIIIFVIVIISVVFILVEI